MVVKDIYENNAANMPYRWWWHPYKTWKDVVFTDLLLSIFFPVARAVFKKFHPVKERDKAIESIQKFRSSLIDSFDKMVSTAIKSWERKAGCPIAEVDYIVPRPKNLVREWKIASVDPHKYTPKEDIPVKIYLPMSLLEAKGVEIPSGKNGLPTIKVHLDNLATELPHDVPLIILFHGGGMTLGRAQEAVETVADMANGKPCVGVFLEYSLAPEVPFPTPIEEALATVSHFMELFPNHPSIHVAGTSAGGYFAAVATMEIHRRHPGRLKSALVGAPVADFSCSSKSYRVNSQNFPNVEWIHWCIQAWLEHPPPEAGESGNSAVNIQKAWNNCKYKGSDLERLLNPLVDLPGGLDAPNAPRIIVTTNRADPLYSEGVALFNGFEKAGAKAKHLDHNGSHWFGTWTDRAAYSELMEEWRKMIF